MPYSASTRGNRPLTVHNQGTCLRYGIRTQTTGTGAYTSYIKEVYNHPTKNERGSIMQQEPAVAIFWDFETARIKGPVSGYQVARSLADVASTFGIVRSFRTYLDVVNQIDPAFASVRRELHSSGVTIIDCPSNSRKDIADKAMIVDMLSVIMDHPPPYTIVVATSDRDLSYTLATLRLRRYKVVLVCPSYTDEGLVMQADESVDWGSQVLGISDNDGSSLSSSSSSSSSSTGALSYASFTPRDNSQRSTATHRGNPRTTLKGSKPRHAPIPERQAQKGEKIHIRSKPQDGRDEASVLSEGSAPASPRASTPNPLLRPGSSTTRSDGATTFTPSPLLNKTPAEMQTGKGATATDLKLRARSGTVSGSFFPPVPSFPLESYPLANATTTMEHKKNSPSSQSTEDFLVVDHPAPQHTKDGPPNPAEGGSGRVAPITLSGSRVAEPTNPPTVNPTTSPGSSPHLVPVPAGTFVVTSRTPTMQAPPAVPSQSSVVHRAPITAAPIVDVPATAVSSPVPTPARMATAPASSSVAGAVPPLLTAQTTLPTPAIAPPLAARTFTPQTEKYRILVRCLQAYRRNGEAWPNQSGVAAAIVHENNHFYQSVRVTKWGQYASQAVTDGIIIKKGDKISLTEDWVNGIV